MQEQLPRDVFEETIGTYLWRVSGGGTRVAATG
jgi:hypothetical protein